MAEVKFLDEHGQAIEFGPFEAEVARRAVLAVGTWADANGFSSLTLRLEPGSAQKLLPQFDDAEPLGSWIDANAVRDGQAEAIEAQLDFALGELRRRAAGIEKYDR